MITTLIFFIFLTFPNQIYADSAESGSQRQIDAVIARIQTQYPFRLYFRDLPPPLPSEPMYQPAEKRDYRGLLAYLLLFEEEISKYPKSYFDKSHLQEIVFVKKLFNGEQPVEGFYAEGDHVIFLDFLRSKGNIITQRHNIHHEFYHMLEARMAGRPHHDAKWASFNDGSFVYGKENVLKQAPNDTSLFTAPFPGFTSEYAMWSASEDRAEVYACLLMASQSKIVHRWMQNDSALKQKVDYIKSIVRQFCEDMDGEFWQKIQRNSLARPQISNKIYSN